MPDYIDVPIDTDPLDVLADFITFMQSVVPGWEPSAGQLDFWIAQGMSVAAAESRDVASNVPKSIFRWFGATLLNFPPIDDAAASCNSTWNMVDNRGYTIPAGTQVSIAKSGDEAYAFATQIDVIVPPGSVSVSGVQLVALNLGSESTGLGALGGPVVLLDPLNFVATITQEGVTTGGIDAEDDDTYLSRLASELQLLAPRPILPNDFALFARQIPGVKRAAAIDGYNPADGSLNNARMVAVALVDALGNPVSSAAKAAVQADLQARREINFIVNAIDPTYTNIDITFNVSVLPTYDPNAVVSAIKTALSSYLNPATWGAGTSTSAVDWINTPTIRYLELSQVINATPGVDYITSTSGNYDLTVGVNGGTQGRVDIVMTGIAPLPRPGILV